MRRVAYITVLDRVAGLLQGLAGASGGGVRGLDRTDAAVANSFINLALKECWESFPWPEVMAVERRMFRPVWASGTVYTAGQQVFFWGTRGYFQALKTTVAGQAPATGTGGSWTVNTAYWACVRGTALEGASCWDSTVAYVAGDRVYQSGDGKVYQAHTANTNHAPPNGTYWGEVLDFVRNIALAQAGETAISLAQRVYDADPRVCDPARVADHEQRFDLFADGIVVRGDVTVVWVKFWPLPGSYTGNAWAAGSTYAADDQVYFTDGDFWRCVTATVAGESPVSAPAKWERVDFPAWLGEAVAWRVFGEMAKLHGSDEDSGMGLSMAAGQLAGEMDRVERQQGQAGQMRVLTR